MFANFVIKNELFRNLSPKKALKRKEVGINPFTGIRSIKKAIGIKTYKSSCGRSEESKILFFSIASCTIAL